MFVEIKAFLMVPNETEMADEMVIWCQPFTNSWEQCCLIIRGCSKNMKCRQFMVGIIFFSHPISMASHSTKPHPLFQYSPLLFSLSLSLNNRNKAISQEHYINISSTWTKVWESCPSLLSFENSVLDNFWGWNGAIHTRKTQSQECKGFLDFWLDDAHEVRAFTPPYRESCK